MATTTGMSPGAVLLRGSRMFSLPPTLPHPPRSRHLKDSTTLTYPIRQSLETPKHCLATGDWGLKRALPGKKTRKAKQPYVRVNHMDTCEGITDFAMATDHTISLRKWHEMGSPISVPKRESPTNVNDFFKSVFEPEFDYTDIPPPRPGKLPTADSLRWHFTGPSLNDMTEGGFQTYLRKRVAPRREAFRTFLRAEMAAQKTNEANRVAFARGHELPAPVSPTSISDDMLMAELRRLREDKARLSSLVRQFLDLAPIQLQEPDHFLTSTPQKVSHGNPWAVEGAPKTHPSVGMMYSRTNSHLDNHPFYGPQAQHAPVRSRILIPATSHNPSPVIGVGGWAVSFHQGTDYEAEAARQSLTQLNYNSPVVAKLWVKVVAAYATASGKLRLKIDRPSLMAPLVERQMRGEISWCMTQARKGKKDVNMPKRMSNYKAYPTVPGSSQSYGLRGSAPPPTSSLMM